MQGNSPVVQVPDIVGGSSVRMPPAAETQGSGNGFKVVSRHVSNLVVDDEVRLQVFKFSHDEN